LCPAKPEGRSSAAASLPSQEILQPAGLSSHLLELPMLNLVSADWVAERLDSPGVQILDPRSVLRYTAGHLKNAINVPVAKARDTNNHIGSPEDLARWLGAAGVGDGRALVIYDNADGRNAAFLAWMLA